MQPATYIGGMYPLIGRPAYPELWDRCFGSWSPCLGATGLSLYDWSGFGNHGALTSITAANGWVPSAGRYAITTPGTAGTGVTIANNAALSIPTGSPWSVSLWFRRNTAGRVDGVINKAAGSLPSSEWSVAWYGAEIYFTVGDPTAGAYIGRYGTWNVTGWNHIVCTYSGGTTSAACTIYGNGVQRDTTNYQSGTFSSTGTTSSNMRLAIDQWLAGTPGLGDFDDIRIYRRMLSMRDNKMLGSRRGISYELAPRRRSSVPVASFNRRRRLLVGAH